MIEQSGERARPIVELLFDFVSPYSWLALARAGEFAQQHGFTWHVRPVVLAALLDATGRVGTGEVREARDFALRDVFYRACELGLPFAPPPVQPFVSLRALRVACLWQDSKSEGLAVARALSAAAWERGEDLTDVGVLERAVDSAGLDHTGIAEAIASPVTKAVLRANTDAAVAIGAFGVPTFITPDGQLVYGQDRMDDVAAKLRGELPEDSAALRRALRGPIAEGRRRAPDSRD
ncbi:MAG: DsbA family protein [Planctomycetes bacterium]|nr:DsbA family protein [Planctomycetota bacterium]